MEVNVALSTKSDLVRRQCAYISINEHDNLNSLRISKDRISNIQAIYGHVGIVQPDPMKCTQAHLIGSGSFDHPSFAWQTDSAQYLPYY